MTPEEKVFRNFIATPKGNMTRAQHDYRSAYDGNLIRTFTDWLPIAGDVQQGVDMYDMLRRGNYAQAGALGALALLPNAIEKPVKKAIPAIKRVFSKLPMGENAYYRSIDAHALDSYRDLGEVTQYAPQGHMASHYGVPMFTKGEPSPYRMKSGSVWLVSKPKSKLQWESAKGGFTPIVDGKYNKAPISDFDFYMQTHDGKFVRLDENLKLPNGQTPSATPYIDYLRGLNRDQQIQYLKGAGLNEDWMYSLENTPSHLNSVLQDRGGWLPYEYY